MEQHPDGQGDTIEPSILFAPKRTAVDLGQESRKRSRVDPQGVDDGMLSDSSDDSEFQDTLPNPKLCTPRLCGRKVSLVRAANDDYFAMLNDTDRNQFFWKAMEALPVHGKRVLDVGAGTGLLSLMAARLGAEQVIAIDGSHDMVEVVRESAEQNGVSEVVRVIHGRSTAVNVAENEKADVIVSETFGVLLLQEDCLTSLVHARQFLAKPGASIIPAGGAQYVTLMMSPLLRSVSSMHVPKSMGVELSHVGKLQQTAKMSFSIPGGFCVNSLPDSSPMSVPICIFSVDFYTAVPADIPQRKTFTVTALQDGQIDAVISSWEAWAGEDQCLRISTHAGDTKGQPWGFARDAHWGQGVQLVEDHSAGSEQSSSDIPAPFVVKKGEQLRLVVCFEEPSRNVFQVIVEREGCTSAVTNSENEDAPIKSASSEHIAASSSKERPRDFLQWQRRCTAASTDMGLPSICDVPNLGGSDGEHQVDGLLLYGDSLPKGFWCPPRLRGQRQIVVEAMNDDYFAMLNDTDHGAFFLEAMKALPVQEQRVLDIGAGAGLLSLLAARLGAKHVLAIESSSEMVRTMQTSVERNGMADKVEVVHGISSYIRIPEEEHRADVIVCEPYDVFLLGQGGGASLEYLADARRHLAKPAAQTIPSGGAQYAVLITSSVLGARSTVCSHNTVQVDLSNLGVLLDTASVMSTREKGFRLSSLPDLAFMSERVNLFSLDFNTATKKSIPRKRSCNLTVLEDGRIDAVVTSWDVWGNNESSRRLTAHAEDTRAPSWGFARDVVYGQGIQLIEDFDAMQGSCSDGPPAPFRVQKGEELQLTMHVSLHRDSIHFTLRRLSAVMNAPAGKPRIGKTGRRRCL